MRFELAYLNRKNLSELIDTFSSIPKTDTTVELVGDYNHASLFGSSIITESLTFLPKHVTSIKFSGKYVYSNNGSDTVVQGTRIVRADVVQGTIVRAGPGNERVIPNIENVYCFRRNVGKLLKEFIVKLPGSVHSVQFNLKRNAVYESSVARRTRTTGTQVPMDFKQIFEILPSHITFLDLCQSNLYEDIASLVRMLSSIPRTVYEIRLGRIALGQRTLLERHSIYSAINRDITMVNLSDNELGNIDGPFVQFFEGLPANLMVLGLGNNNLSRRGRDDICAIFRELPQKLDHLILSGNRLSLVAAADLAAAFSCLTGTLKKLDLGENGILALSVADFITVMTGLPPTMKWLRLCEGNNHTLSVEVLAARFACIPGQITTLSVSGSNLLGLTLPDFIILLSHLPNTIDTLDLCDNSLCSRDSAELLCLFSNLPASIKTLKLGRNALSSLDDRLLKGIFAALPKTIVAVDIQNNGFDRILHTRLNELLDNFPDIAIAIEVSKLGIRNDGALVIHSPLSNVGLFKPEGQIRHQKEFARTLIVLGQLMSDKHLNANIMQTILSLLFGRTTPSRMMQMVGKVETAITLISERPPIVITPATELECKHAVHTRISTLVLGATKLDLSRCGLNRLDSADKLKSVFRSVPNIIDSLSLRGNGFSYTETNRTMLIDALSSLHPEIKYLDLSDNGFEQDDSARVAQLFSRLPATVKWVSLSQEKPSSPADNIAKRRWPLAYHVLVSESSDILMQARILLDNYTLGDSAMRRFFYGHWNRHHTKEVAKIVKAIDKGHIICIEDLLSELELIDALNPKGSFTRRIAFLYKASFESNHEERAEVDDGVEFLEMSSLISGK